MNAREKALRIGNISLQLLDDLAQVVPGLGVLVNLRLQLLKELGIDHSRHIVTRWVCISIDRLCLFWPKFLRHAEVLISMLYAELHPGEDSL